MDASRPTQLVRILLTSLKAERIQLDEREEVGLEDFPDLLDRSFLAGEYLLPTPGAAWAFAQLLRELAEAAEVELAITVEGRRVGAREAEEGLGSSDGI